MSVSPDIVVAEGAYNLRNGEIAHLTARGPAHASIKTFESRAHPGHVWYSPGYTVARRDNFYPYYEDDDWVAVPDLYVVGRADHVKDHLKENENA